MTTWYSISLSTAVGSEPSVNGLFSVLNSTHVVEELYNYRYVTNSSLGGSILLPVGEYGNDNIFENETFTNLGLAIRFVPDFNTVSNHMDAVVYLFTANSFKMILTNGSTITTNNIFNVSQIASPYKITWYSIHILMGSETIFNGYFSKLNRNNTIQEFYNAENLDVDILLPMGELGNTNTIEDDGRVGLGFAITSIPAVDSQYSNLIGYRFYVVGCYVYIQDSDAIRTFYEYTISETTDPFINRLISNICFPAGTPVTTDQGPISIENLHPKLHTICNKPIVGITKTVTKDKYLVCFEKNVFGPNVPSQNTVMSSNHYLFFDGKMVKAHDFICRFQKVKPILYSGEILYNVLMEEHATMKINNLICETLHPENQIAKLYRQLPSLKRNEQQQLIQRWNRYTTRKHKKTALVYLHLQTNSSK